VLLLAPAVLLLAPAVLLFAPAVLLFAPAVLLFAPAVLLFAPAVLLLAPAEAPLESLPPPHALTVRSTDNNPARRPNALEPIAPKCHGLLGLPIPPCAQRASRAEMFTLDRARKCAQER
jgi:hypothetical protein